MTAMVTRWEVEKAVKASNIDITGRGILMILLSESNSGTAEIPPNHAPTFTDLERITGASRSTLVEWMRALSAGGWVSKLVVEGESRTGFALSVGDPDAARAPRKRAEKTAESVNVPTPHPATGDDAACRQAIRPNVGSVPPGDTERAARRYGGMPPGDTPSGSLLFRNSPTESSTTNPTLNPRLFAEGEKPATKKQAAKPKRVEPIREDVERICEHLAQRVIENGSLATVTDTWRREARLLLDKPRPIPVTVEKVIALIDWCQDSEFWAPNIRCMKTFRKQYDGLRLRALNEYKQGRLNGGLKSNGHQPYTNPADQSEYDEWTVNQ